MQSLRKLLADVDQLLRGRFTRREDLIEARIQIPIRSLVLAGILLGAVYGVFMGLYAVLRGGDGSTAQLLTTAAKVPLLFLLTLAVTFPSLYVLSALAGSRLLAPDTLRLLLGALAVNLALLASLGPVTGFFTLSTSSYAFMVVLNVLFFAVSGLVGLVFLGRALEGLFAPAAPREPVVAIEETLEQADDEEHADDPDTETDAAQPPPTLRVPRNGQRLARRIFFTWTVVFAIVGAQMGWILRPFIGAPGQPFQLFRARESSFFESFFKSLVNLFS